jgi:acyl-CoA thioesterase
MRPMTTSDTESVPNLFDLTPEGADGFRAPAFDLVLPHGVPGRHLPARAILAAARTAPPAATVRSVHARMQSPCNPDSAVEYLVSRLGDRDGCFARSVTGFQCGRVVIAASILLATSERWTVGGTETRMPDCPHPLTLPRVGRPSEGNDRSTDEHGPAREIEVRMVPSSSRTARSTLWWQRSLARPPGPAVAHQAMLVYMSVPPPAAPGSDSPWISDESTLSIRFRGEARADAWMLVRNDGRAPGSSERGAGVEVFGSDGRLLMSLTH